MAPISFCPDEDAVLPPTSPTLPRGLFVYPRALDELECESILAEMAASHWWDAVPGRPNQVMHYGPRLPPWALDLVLRIPPPSDDEVRRCGPRPWSTRPVPFDQLIVNTYRVGEGLAPHVDLPTFDDGVVSFSLSGTCAMRFARVVDASALPIGLGGRKGQWDDDQAAAAEKVEVEGEKVPSSTQPAPTSTAPTAPPVLDVFDLYLEAGDMLLLSGEARYRWTHGIAPRTWDITPEGAVQPRTVRVSVTARRMLPTHPFARTQTPPHGPTHVDEDEERKDGAHQRSEII